MVECMSLSRAAPGLGSGLGGPRRLSWQLPHPHLPQWRLGKGDALRGPQHGAHCQGASREHRGPHPEGHDLLKWQCSPRSRAARNLSIQARGRATPPWRHAGAPGPSCRTPRATGPRATPVRPSGRPRAAAGLPSARSPVSAVALIPGAPLDKSPGRLSASARGGAQPSRAHQRVGARRTTPRSRGSRAARAGRGEPDSGLFRERGADRDLGRPRAAPGLGSGLRGPRRLR